MAKLLKLRRGSTTQHASFTGAEGEVTIDTTKDTAVVHDGAQAGGRPLAREDMSNVSSSAIVGQIGTGAIGTDRLSAGGLPANVTVASANIVNGTIVNDDIAANAAIAGTKLENSGVTAGQYGSSSAIPIVTVDAQGLVTAASTTAIDSTTIQNGSSSVSVANNGAITSNANHDFSAGIDVTGDITTTGHITLGDSQNIKLGNSQDFLIYHNGSNSIINDNGTGNLEVVTNGTKITLQGGSDTMADFIKDGKVALFHDNSEKLETQSSGIGVAGNISVTGTVDGRDVAADGTKLDGLASSTVGQLKDGVTAVTVGQGNNSTQVATTAYVRTAIANAQAFPSGTKMLFQQTAAPTGWTKVTSGVDNKSLRVVSGTVGSGGSNAFTNTFTNKSITANAGNTTAGGNISVSQTSAGGSVSIDSASTGGTVNSHTLSTNEMPSHRHQLTKWAQTNYNWQTANQPGFNFHIQNLNAQNWTNQSGNTRSANALYGYTDYTGGGGGHSHGFTGGSHNHNGNLSGSAHNHNATFTGSAHNHSISVNNLDLAVQYLDVIIASKD